MALKYGFFDAHKLDTGEYDRVYSSDDLNRYLKGIINQNGVFASVGGCLRVTPGDEVFSNFFNFVNADGEEKILLKVQPGKAIVDSHWVDLDAEYDVYLDPPRADRRVDKISLRCVEDDGGRICYICVESSDLDEGQDGRSTLGPIPFGKMPRYPIGNKQYSAVIPIGQTVVYIPEAQAYVNRGFEPEFGLSEIVLAYVLIPAKGEMNPESIFTINDEVGFQYCPWISHMVLDPNQPDVDKWISRYTAIFDAWLQELIEKNELDQTLDINEYTLGSGSALPVILKPADDSGHTCPFPGYVFDTKDVFMVYFNGLKMIEKLDYELVQYPENTDVKTGWMLKFAKLQSRYSSIPSGNEMDVVIIKGSLTNIPDGDQFAY